MNPTHRLPRHAPWVYGLLLVLGAALLLPTTGGLLHAIRVAALWLLVMVGPGVALFYHVERRSLGALELLLAGLIASPLLLTLVAIATLFAGSSNENPAGWYLVVASLLVLGAAHVRRPALQSPKRREAIALIVFTVVLLILVSTLPFTREWWRIRSDAWFHAAVVEQIRDFGLPPEDPYFLGLPLQYMWFYHVLVYALADVLRVNSFWVMALVNAHATVALVLAAYQLASVLHPRLPHRFAAMATVVLAFNAAFWIFLPVKLVKAFIGDVRGFDEVARTFTLTPFDYNTVLGFTNIYFNQEFFLDKFMVATAFGLALVFMLAAWAGAVDYLKSGRPFALALFAVSLVGMLGFHSLVGFVFLVGTVGAITLLHLTRTRHHGYQPRAAAVILAVSLLCLAAMTPYLHQVMHAKERTQVFPLDFSLRKTIGILISSAFVMALAARARAFWSDRSVGTCFFVFTTALVTLFCFSIRLPGPNTYDKLGYFVFVPFAIVAGFALADSVLARSGRARIAVAAAWALLFLVPVNALTFASCFTTADAVEVTPAEARLSAWVRTHTPREAVFIDDHDRVPLLVTGPRRYLWGVEAYSDQWGYPVSEMSRRRHAVRALYADADLDAAALDVLASIDEPLFVVVRREHSGRAVAENPDLFQIVYHDDEISLVRVDRDACLARSGP